MVAADGGLPTLQIAIIGAGTAGRQFALACAGAGFRVILEDVMPAKLRHAAAELTAFGCSVDLALTVEDAVRDADIAIDFVPDELESKLEILSMIDRMAPPKTVMATPSDSLSITDLASCTYRADRCIMLRGLFQANGTVRLLAARETSASTRGLADMLCKRLGRTTLHEHDPDLPMLLKNMNAAHL